MRTPHASPFLRRLAVTLALTFATSLTLGVVAATPGYADDRARARTHYQAGSKFYSAGDYRSAIREFSAAQQLLPADLNNYNLALCYDKLGDPEPAMQYYRAYLDKVPTTDKRTEIEASIARLDAAAKSIAAKRAEEAEAARKIDEARRVESERAAEARLLEQTARAEAEAARAAEAAAEARLVEEAPAPSVPPAPMISGGSTGVPSSGVVSSGDPQLDRVAQINIDQIRDQRVGSAGSGIAAAPPVAGAPAGAGAPVGAAAGAPQAGFGGPQEQPVVKSTPLYKKWWFWAVVGVSAYVVIQIATEDSEYPTRGRLLLPEGPAAPPPGGLTLMRW